MLLLVLQLLLVVALAANPYEGATLYSSSTWSTMIAPASEPGTPIAAQPSLTSLANTISTYPDAIWLTSQSDAAAMNTILADAAIMASPITVTFVANFIPNRDCIGRNAEAAASPTAYQNYLNTIIGAAQTHPTVRLSVIIEPNAIFYINGDTCAYASGYSLALQAAINTLAASVNIALYLDIGNNSPSSRYCLIGSNCYNDIVARTGGSRDQNTGVPIAAAVAAAANAIYAATLAPTITKILSGTTSTSRIRGFSTNVGNYYTLEVELPFITAMNTALIPFGYGHMRFITDTSRNGVKPPRIGGERCNIVGASLGLPPQSTPPGYPLLDAFLWIKRPGLSDGASPSAWSIPVNATCAGPNSVPNAPAAGLLFNSNLAMLLQNAIMNSAGPRTGMEHPIALNTMNPFQGATMYSSSAWAAMITIATSPGTDVAKSPSLMALAQNITSYPDTIWITSPLLIGLVDSVLAGAASFSSSPDFQPTTVTIVINYIPNRGCTTGAGAANLADYQVFLNMIANEAMAFPSVQVVIIIEPGAVVAMATSACNANNALYIAALKAVIATLGLLSNTALYIDIGTSSTVSESIIINVSALVSTILGNSRSVRGLATNVAMYDPFPAQYDFITAVMSTLSTQGLARLRFITDTSRNGLNTFARSGEWCNVNGAALGMAPIASPEEYPLIDAFVYAKSPGLSDGYSPMSVTSNAAGTCTGPNSVLGAPIQGTFFPDYLTMLLSNTITGEGGSAPTSLPPGHVSSPSTNPAVSDTGPTISADEQVDPLLVFLIAIGLILIILICCLLERCRRTPVSRKTYLTSMINPKILRNMSRVRLRRDRQMTNVLSSGGSLKSGEPSTFNGHLGSSVSGGPQGDRGSQVYRSSLAQLGSNDAIPATQPEQLDTVNEADRTPHV